MQIGCGLFGVLKVRSKYKRLIYDGIKRNSPPAGIVSLLCITEKQFADMEYITGEFVSDVIDSDERLVIL